MYVGYSQNCGEIVDVTEDDQEVAVNRTRPNLCLRCVRGVTASSNTQWIIGPVVLNPGQNSPDNNLMNVGGVLVIVDSSNLIMDGPTPYQISDCLSASPVFRWRDIELFSSSK